MCKVNVISSHSAQLAMGRILGTIVLLRPRIRTFSRKTGSQRIDK